MSPSGTSATAPGAPGHRRAPASARGSSGGVSGAMTSASCPVRRRCSSTRSTELLTPLTFGRKLSATIATRTPRECQRRMSARLRWGRRHTKSRGRRYRPDMRSWARVCAAVAVLALVTAGCSRVVAGAAQPDPFRPGVAVTEDGYGIVVGLPDAPAEVEIYTEPQCEHCADFQARFGEDLRSHLRVGQLAVVYRPLTFLDDEYDTDYSAAPPTRCSWPPHPRRRRRRSRRSSRTCGRIRTWPSRNSPTTTSRYWPVRAASTPTSSPRSAPAHPVSTPSR